MKLSLALLLLPTLIGCGGLPREEPAAVTFHIIARDTPEPRTLFIAGDIPPLGTWDPDGLRLAQESDTSWVSTVRIPLGQTIQFKVTRGSWRTEAVGSDGLELPNYRATITGDTTLTIVVALWRDKLRRSTLLSTERLQNKGGVIELLDLWKFAPGDDPIWADPSFLDTAWQEVRSYLPPDQPLPLGWHGIGWFRLHLEVDSSLQGRALAIVIRQTGASQWYLNGDSLLTLGRPSGSLESEEAFTDLSPHVVVLPLRTHQVLAVRFSNQRAEAWHHQSSGAGFYAVLEYAQDAIAAALERTRTISVYQILLTTVGVLLGVLHLFLFAFERRERANLYFSLLMLGVSTLTYLDFVGFTASDPVFLLTLAELRGIPVGIVAVFALLTAYSTRGRAMPRHALVAPVLAIALATWTLVAPWQGSTIGVPILIALVSVEVIRVVTQEFFARKRTGHSIGITGWIGGAGAIVFIVGVLWQILINLDLLPRILPVPPIYVGFMIFAVGISANLAWQWSMTTRILRAKLEEIEMLSAHALEQEQRARADEVQRRLLEADNQRKTQELEDARRLQLSMLPQSIPSVEGLKIGVYMKTATEVGGDYYDFLTADDGSLTIAVGDATGHGMKAGLMVTLVKSMFHTRGNSFFIPDFFNYGTTLIRRMNMEGVYMSLMLARIHNGHVTMSSAGMPPVLLHRAATGEVEEFRMTGMPLGASPGFPYTQRTTSLGPGDTLLIMSDGLPEHFNNAQEMFEVWRVKQELAVSAGTPPQSIIETLVAAGDRWSAGGPPHDDMTFVVVRSTGVSPSTNS
jgi:serine phosphatase RsbU (regulator of sigma subunit)